jgi:hypothetical protein
MIDGLQKDSDERTIFPDCAVTNPIYALLPRPVGSIEYRTMSDL